MATKRKGSPFYEEVGERTLPKDDTVTISIPTTRWVMEEIQRHAASGRYPRSFSACAEEFLRRALRDEERGTGKETSRDE